MHGIKREDVENRTLDEIQKERQRASEYNKLMGAILEKRVAHDMSLSVMSGIEHALLITPECYTLWNYRREILLAQLEKTTELSPLLQEKPIEQELFFIKKALDVNPKVYSMWNHRLFLVQLLKKRREERGEDTNKLLTDEVELVERQLHRDARNFHAWTHLRNLVNDLCEREEVFVTKASSLCSALVHKDPGNWSAWHHWGLWSDLEEKEFREPWVELAQDACLLLPESETPWYALEMAERFMSEEELKDIVSWYYDSLEIIGDDMELSAPEYKEDEEKGKGEREIIKDRITTLKHHIESECGEEKMKDIISTKLFCIALDCLLSIVETKCD